MKWNTEFGCPVIPNIPLLQPDYAGYMTLWECG